MVFAIVFSPVDPNIIITTECNRCLCVWNIAERSRTQLQDHHLTAQALCVSADGRLLCSKSIGDHELYCHDLFHNNTLLWKRKPQKVTDGNTVHHDGRFFVPVRGIGIVVLDAMTGAEHCILTQHLDGGTLVVLHLRKIGLLHLNLHCDVNLHSEHCMPGSLTKPALRNPQHQSDDTHHGDGLREGFSKHA